MVLRLWKSALFTAALVTGVHASEQFHLTLAGDGSSDYFVDWVTPKSNDTSHVPVSQLYVGDSPTTLKKAVVGVLNGEVEEEPGTYVNCWTARLSNLVPDQPVFYAVDKSAPTPSTPAPTTATPEPTTATPAPTSTSRPIYGDASVTVEVESASVGNTGTNAPITVGEVHSFVPKTAATDLTWAVWADMGAAMQGGSAGVALRALETAVKNKDFDAMLNLGDLSYELTQANGKDYIERLAPITSRVPMHVTTGNHEYDHALAPEFTLRNYYRRFGGQNAGVAQSSGSKSNEYYSFNQGRVHFVILNTELYGDDLYTKPNSEGEWEVADEVQRAKDSLAQAAWMKVDLSKVNRAETPFVVVGSHRCPFRAPKGLDKSDNRFGPEIVPLLDEFKVDLYLCGHAHHYIQFKEFTHMNYTIPPIIVSGAAGLDEGLDKFEDIKINGFTPEFHFEAFGYGLVKATESALEWRWGSTGGIDAVPTDWTYVHSYTVPRRTFN